MTRPLEFFRRISPSALTGLLLVLPALVVAGATWTALLAHRQFPQVVDGLEHASAIQQSLGAVLAAVTDAETGARGFLISEDPRFLEAYTRSAPRIPHLLDTMVGVAGPERREEMARVRRLVEARMAEVDARVTSGRQGRFTEAREAVAQGTGKGLMDQLRAAVATVEAEQARLHGERLAHLRDVLRTQSLALWTLLVVFGLALGGGLLEMSRRLRHHEQIVTMCAWSHTVHDGEAWVSIEDYLHRHYDVTISHGISPEQFALAKQAVDAARARRAATSPAGTPADDSART